MNDVMNTVRLLDTVYRELLICNNYTPSYTNLSQRMPTIFGDELTGCDNRRDGAVPAPAFRS